MHHGLEFTVVLFLCVALGLGAVTRLFGRAVRLPYTVVVLLLGFAIGLVTAETGGQEHFEVLARLWTGTSIAPDLIIFVFLPALVFESAFALDVHAFRKELGAVILLAVPALLVSTVMAGAWLYVVSDISWQWPLTAALVFGALISATDPVAVVAILRDTNSPKRLGLLIEGESLLNDGTAIVVFSSLIMLLEPGAADVGLGHRVLDFLVVVGGGVGVGLLIAVALSSLIARTFNDPLAEITLTIVTAYGAMFIAEGFLHVSGVMAIVTAGLWMAGPGRTRISPEVQHFLHQFWEMVAYIANTLIFFLVGLVISAQWHSAVAADWLIVLAGFVGVMLIRFAITFAFRPLIGWISEPLSTRETVLVSWGGLRGAVSLALALIVSQQPYLSEPLRRQILLVTTGVVLLTILINGSTVAWLLGKLGLMARPLAQEIADLSVQASLLDDVRERIGEVSKSPDLRMVPWADVDSELSGRRHRVSGQLNAAQKALEAADDSARAAGYWQQALSMERRCYWEAYATGTLGATAAHILDREIARHLDRLAVGDTEPPESRTEAASRWRRRLMRWLPRWGALAHAEFDSLALLYDLSRAQVLAAERVLVHLERFERSDADSVREVRRAYEQFRNLGRERLEDLRASLPEIAQAIELRLARRIQLNLELAAYHELVESGAMEDSIANQAIRSIERQMKVLHEGPRTVPIPETADLVRSMPLFADLGEDALSELAAITEEEVFSPGVALVEEGTRGDSMFVIARGAVHVTKKEKEAHILLDTLGGGDIIGEMSLLTGEPRTATVKTATTVTVGRVSRQAFDRVMHTQPQLRDRIWHVFSQHRFDNTARRDWRFQALDSDGRKAWLESGTFTGPLEEGAIIEPGEAEFLFLVHGEAECHGSRRSGPCLLELQSGDVYQVTRELRAVLLPRPQHDA